MPERRTRVVEKSGLVKWIYKSMIESIDQLQPYPDDGKTTYYCHMCGNTEHPLLANLKLNYVNKLYTLHWYKGHKDYIVVLGNRSRTDLVPDIHGSKHNEIIGVLDNNIPICSKCPYILTGAHIYHREVRLAAMTDMRLIEANKEDIALYYVDSSCRALHKEQILENLLKTTYLNYHNILRMSVANGSSTLARTEQIIRFMEKNKIPIDRETSSICLLLLIGKMYLPSVKEYYYTSDVQ